MSHLARQHAEHARPVFTDAARQPARRKAKNPPETERVSVDQFEAAIEKAEAALGLGVCKGQGKPAKDYVVVGGELQGEPTMTESLRSVLLEPR